MYLQEYGLTCELRLYDNLTNCSYPYSIYKDISSIVENIIEIIETNSDKEYDIVLKKHGDPFYIKLSYIGVNNVILNKSTDKDTPKIVIDLIEQLEKIKH